MDPIMQFFAYTSTCLFICRRCQSHSVRWRSSFRSCCRATRSARWRCASCWSRRTPQFGRGCSRSEGKAGEEAGDYFPAPGTGMKSQAGRSKSRSTPR